MTDPTFNPKPAGLGAGLRRLLLGAAFAASFVAGGVIMSSTPAVAFTVAMEQSAMGMHGHGAMRAMAQAHIEKMLTAVDATPDQKEKIRTILHTGFESIAPLHERLADTHRDLHRLMAAPTIDRAALEQLRAARVADLDQASKVMVQTFADAADVLRPDQRAKLASLMAEHQHAHP